jgi:hypothetical protein
MALLGPTYLSIFGKSSHLNCSLHNKYQKQFPPTRPYQDLHVYQFLNKPPMVLIRPHANIRNSRVGIGSKGSFYSGCSNRFSNRQISKKKYIPNFYPELEIWICCLLLLARNLNFMFRIVIWNNFFLEIWRFEEHITLSEKKPPLEKWSIAT